MKRLWWCALILGLAAPVLAQRDALVGTWEFQQQVEEQGVALIPRLELRENGDFVLSAETIQTKEQLFQGLGENGGQDSVATEDGGASLGLHQIRVAAKLLGTSRVAQEDSLSALLDSAGVGDLLLPVLLESIPDTLHIAVKFAGIWEADDKNLRLDAQTSQVLINELELPAFMEQLAKGMARALATQLALPEADYPAFESEIVQAISGDAEEQFASGLDPAEMDLAGTYALQGDILSITDEQGEITTLTRLLSSAVAPTSWGQVKAGMP